MNIFRHLKLEIASAIPASNELQIEANNSAALVLSTKVTIDIHECGKLKETCDIYEQMWSVHQK